MTVSIRAFVARREILANGVVQVLISKEIRNGDVLMSSGNHRVALTPGCDIDATIVMVDSHLTQLGFGAVPADDWQKVKATILAEWTPDVVAAYAQSQAEDTPQPDTVGDQA